MSLIALVIIGITSFNYIPISLMPNIDIPQITVQVSYPGASVREVDSKVLKPLKNQMMQVVGLKNIQSESQMDAGSIFMSFEPGSNIDLIFIEVNEKMDRVMNSMPKELERPKVLKASATDIPAFYLDLTLKDEYIYTHDSLPQAGVSFTQLGDFARNIVTKRIEQLPQTAMVDISGVVTPELLCIPNYQKMESMEVTNALLENAIKENNITLGILSIADGVYRYNIHFDSQLTTKEDIENIYINEKGRIYQLKDLCELIEKPAKRKGLVRSNKQNAITMAIIKQNNAQMEDLQKSIANLISDLEKEYPNIKFELTRDQTQLLTYSIQNLKNNLLIGALLACLVLVLFMKDLRLSLLIIITIPLSLIFSLLLFHILGITLNIISLSGLILGMGMIVDNSIIVIDNITQKWKNNTVLTEAIVKATSEVFAPMLSSALTTCSVFVPLIFLSGVTGALFYDQAMAVSIALFASLLVSVLVIPVYFYFFYKNKKTPYKAEAIRDKKNINFYAPYEHILKWTLRHPKTMLFFFFTITPFVYIIYSQIDKSRLPYIEYDDALMTIDWNAGISVEENDNRVAKLLDIIKEQLQKSTTMIGMQDFLLSHTKDITTSEAVVYLKANSENDLNKAKSCILSYINVHYPKGIVDFTVSGNIFDMIFSENKPDLEILIQDKTGGCPMVANIREFIDILSNEFPEIYIPPIVLEENIHYEADIEQMSVYDVTYNTLFNRLRELVNQQNLFQINHGSFSVPVTFGTGRKESRDLLQSKVKNKQGVDIPLAYLINETKREDFKKLYSGNGGDYYPIKINATDKQIEKVINFTNNYVRNSNTFFVSFDGSYYSSRQLIMELITILLVAIALLYFIMAAQFESIIQPFIILSEILIDILGVLLGLYILGESLNIMSLIGIVVMSGIVINDSILKVDTINRLRRNGTSLIRAIIQGGRSRLKPIIMTSLTTILAIVPFLNRIDMGSYLQYPLSLAIIIGMSIGTIVSLFFIPLMYYIIYRKKTE